MPLKTLHLTNAWHRSSGGLLSYAGKENAWLVEPTSECFAGAVRQVLEDERLRLMRTDAARSTALRHSWLHATNRYFTLYRELHARTCGHRMDWSVTPAFYSTRKQTFRTSIV